MSSCVSKEVKGASTQRGGYNFVGSNTSTSSGPGQSVAPSTLNFRVHFRTGFSKVASLLFHAFVDRGFFFDALFGSELSYVFGDSHRTKMWTAHRTEVSGLCPLLR